VTDGNLILSTVSVGGFINDAGTLGGLATEFSSTFNNSSGGTGQAALNVTGGSEAAYFNTNFFASPFIPGVTADLFAQFTTVINTSTGDWLVRSNDPVTGNFVPVPEPSTYGFAAVVGLLGIVALRRRNRQQSQA
jgi:MYXO-CTERM domain-containing protein